MLKKTFLFFLVLMLLSVSLSYAIDQQVVMEIQGMVCEL